MTDKLNQVSQTVKKYRSWLDNAMYRDDIPYVGDLLKDLEKILYNHEDNKLDY